MNATPKISPINTTNIVFVFTRLKDKIPLLNKIINGIEKIAKAKNRIVRLRISLSLRVQEGTGV